MSYTAQDAVDRQIVNMLAALERRGSGILTYRVGIPNCATFMAAMEVFEVGNGFEPAKLAATALPLLQEASCVVLGRWAKGETIELSVPYTVGAQLVNAPGPIGERLPDEWRIDYARRVIDWGRTVVGADLVKVDQLGRLETETNRPGKAPTTLRLLWD